MDREFAVLREQCGYIIFLTYAGAARDKGDLGGLLESFSNGMLIVGNNRTANGLAPVAFDKRGKHRALCICDFVAVWASTHREQLVAGDQDVDTRAPYNGDVRKAQRRKHADILRPNC